MYDRIQRGWERASTELSGTEAFWQRSALGLSLFGDVQHVLLPHVGGDLLDAGVIEALVAEIRPEAIFHLAAYGTHPHERDMPQMLQVNVHGTANLLAAVAKVPCAAFIHAGSLKEYRESALPITEESALGPRDGSVRNLDTKCEEDQHPYVRNFVRAVPFTCLEENHATTTTVPRRRVYPACE